MLNKSARVPLIISNTLDLIFDNLILSSAFALIGLGLWFIIKVFKK